MIAGWYIGLGEALEDEGVHEGAETDLGKLTDVFDAQ